MKAVLVISLLAACGGGGGGDSMATDAANPASDASAQLQGLLVSWTANPALPGPIKTDLSVTSATFHVSRLQVIGDNGQPMTPASIDIAWKGEGDPAVIAFPTAPAGLYSKITLDIDQPQLDTCYEIFGTVKVAGVTKPFHILDRNALDVDIKDYNVTLAPGGTATASIKLDLKDALSSVPYDQLNEDDGTLELDTLDPPMVEFRDKLKDAFKKGP